MNINQKPENKEKKLILLVYGSSTICPQKGESRSSYSWLSLA